MDTPAEVIANIPTNARVPSPCINSLNNNFQSATSSTHLSSFLNVAMAVCILIIAFLIYRRLFLVWVVVHCNIFCFSHSTLSLWSKALRLNFSRYDACSRQKWRKLSCLVMGSGKIIFTSKRLIQFIATLMSDRNYVWAAFSINAHKFEAVTT